MKDLNHQVRGYAPRQLPAHTGEAAACAAQLEELMKAKQELLYELHAYEYCNTIGAVGAVCRDGVDRLLVPHVYAKCT